MEFPFVQDAVLLSEAFTKLSILKCYVSALLVQLMRNPIQELLC